MATNSGSAYILPGNQAAGIFVNGIDELRKKEELERLAAIKRQQDLADTNAKTLGDFKLPSHWGARSSELQKSYEDLTNYALQVTQKGGNLNTDRDFIQKKNQLMTNAAATQDLQKMYDQTYAEVGKNPDAYENGLEILKSFQGASLDDYTSGKFKPEQLRKIYTLNDAVKDSGGAISYVKNNDGTYDTTRVNRSGNIGQAISSLSTPSAKYLIQKAGGDTDGYVAGFPTVTKEGKTYYNTSGKDFEDAVINTLATDANFPAYLQQKGYDVSSTDSIRKSAMDYAKKQNEATGKYVKDYADVLENRATTDTTRTFAAEQNARANRGEQRAEESHAVSMRESAEKALADSPDAIATNVTTNLATKQSNGKVVLRPSTSFAAANVGNSKSSFLPSIIIDPETGVGKQNAASLAVTGGQVHIKPVLKFGGTTKLMDDESMEKLKAGTYKVNGKLVPKNAIVSYEELLYGEERVPSAPDKFGMSQPASVRKVILPVTGQSLDKKFDKGYNRVEMWQSAIKSMPDQEDKKRAAMQVVKQYNPGRSDAELKEQAAAYLNSLN